MYNEFLKEILGPMQWTKANLTTQESNNHFILWLKSNPLGRETIILYCDQNQTHSGGQQLFYIVTKIKPTQESNIYFG